MAAKTKLTAPDVTLERLRSVLDYDQETGIFTWAKGVNKFVQWKVGSHAGTDCNGYISIVIDYRMYLAHRLAWFYVYGEWPNGQIDHIDLNRSNNRISNLRTATNGQNSTNKKVRKDCKSGFKGVQLLHSGRWRARLVSEHLGCFDTPEMANNAYLEAAVRKYGKYANGG